MRTLDEVIEALEYCLNPVDNFGNCNAECPYIHCCDPSNHDVTEDALKYLKLLKAHCDRVQNQIEDLREEYRPNEPLTWDELKSMEGKPVWIEIGVCKIWGLNDGVHVDAFGKEKVTIKVLHDLWHLRKEKMGDADGWQAYRKER